MPAGVHSFVTSYSLCMCWMLHEVKIRRNMMICLGILQVIELHDVTTDGKELTPSPQEREERRNSRTRDQFDFDRESMQDMELREEDEAMIRGSQDYCK
jgi:hypothetical protein